MKTRSRKRSAAMLVECSIVFPIFFLLFIGLLVAALGVFRYQQMASLAREGARYASVHGDQYRRATGNAAATPQEVFEKAVLPNAVALDRNKLNYKVTWSPDNRQGSRVTVTLTYKWIPEVFFGGRDLTSTSTMEMSF